MDKATAELQERIDHLNVEPMPVSPELRELLNNAARNPAPASSDREGMTITRQSCPNQTRRASVHQRLEDAGITVLGIKDGKPGKLLIIAEADI